MVEIGCGGRCAKGIVMLINFIFVLIGLFLLGFGIFLVINTTALHNHYFLPFGGSAQQMVVAAGVILIVGVAILLVTIIGCCAASKESTGCLTFYAVILIFLLVLQIAAVIVAGVFYDKIISNLDDEMIKIVQKQYGQPNKTSETDFIDFIQTELKCCGVTVQGPLDWKNSTYHQQTSHTVPDTCCTSNGTKGYYVDVPKCRSEAYETKVHGREQYIHVEGCDNKIDALVKHYVGVIVGVVIGIVVLQVIFIVITCLLKSSISRGYEYV